jgi:hypothetical protein
VGLAPDARAEPTPFCSPAGRVLRGPGRPTHTSQQVTTCGLQKLPLGRTTPATRLSLPHPSELSTETIRWPYGIRRPPGPAGR